MFYRFPSGALGWLLALGTLGVEPHQQPLALLVPLLQPVARS